MKIVSMRSICLAVVLILAASAAGCADEEGDDKSPQEPLVVGTSQYLDTLDPAVTYRIDVWEFFLNVNRPLLVMRPGTTEPMLGVASGFEVSGDGSEYVFTLRPDLTFADGSPFDAEAMKYTIERVLTIDGPSVVLVRDYVERVEVVDSLNVKFILKDSFGFFPSMVWSGPYYPVNKSLFAADAGLDVPGSGIDVTALFGLGAYRIARMEFDPTATDNGAYTEIELHANPDYYGDPPHHETVIVKYFSGEQTLEDAVMSGEVDVAKRTIARASYQRLKRDENVNVFDGAGYCLHFLSFRSDIAPFNNEALRKAMACAVERTRIVDDVFHGSAVQMHSMLPKSMWGYDPSFETACGGQERNLERAKELLVAEGYSEQNPFVFDLWTWDEETVQLIAAKVKEAIEETGIVQVTVQSTTWEKFWAVLTSQDPVSPGGEYYGAWMFWWFGDYVDPNAWLSPFGHSSSSSYLGLHYEDAEMDTILNRAVKSTDRTARKADYQQIQSIWAQRVPTVPLAQEFDIIVTQKDVDIGATPVGLPLLDYAMVERK